MMSDLRVERIELNQLPGEAQALLDSNNSLFCSAGFASLWESVGGRPVWWIVRKEEDVVAMIAGVEFGRKPVLRFQTMPDGCYTRLLPNEGTPYVPQLLQGLSSYGYARTFIHDFFNQFYKVDPFRVDDCATTLVAISDDDWEPPDKTLRSELRKAEREGVVLETFNSDRQMDSFIELMESTERRHGRTTKYSRPFYEALADLAAKDERIIWRWCEHEGEAVCSHIYFREEDQLIYWQSYFDKAFSFLKANQYMLYQTTREMIEDGVSLLNLGASPDEADMLLAYKNKWGGQTYDYQRLMSRSGVGKIL